MSSLLPFSREGTEWGKVKIISVCEDTDEYIGQKLFWSVGHRPDQRYDI